MKALAVLKNGCRRYLEAADELPEDRSSLEKEDLVGLVAEYEEIFNYMIDEGGVRRPIKPKMVDRERVKKIVPVEEVENKGNVMVREEDK